jgi:hypothetical protein
VGRERRQPNPKTYSGRLAARLRELRDSKGWSIEDLQARLTRYGATVPTSTIYSYEVGKEAGGADLPWHLVPIVAKVYGYQTANGWLPST